MSKNNLVWMSVDEAYGRPVSGGYAPDPLCIACRQGISGMYSQEEAPGAIAEFVDAGQGETLQSGETNGGGTRPIVWDHAPSEPIEHVQIIPTRHNVTSEFERIHEREFERAGR